MYLVYLDDGNDSGTQFNTWEQALSFAKQHERYSIYRFGWGNWRPYVCHWPPITEWDGKLPTLCGGGRNW